MKTVDVIAQELHRQAHGDATALVFRAETAGKGALVGGRIDLAALAEAIERELLLPKLLLRMRTVVFDGSREAP